MTRITSLATTWAAILLLLPGCAVFSSEDDESVSTTELPRRTERPSTRTMTGSGYAFSVPAAWDKVKRDELAQLGIPTADLAAASGADPCDADVLAPDAESSTTVQPVVASTGCSRKQPSQLVSVGISPNLPPLTVATAEEALRQTFEEISPGLASTSKPRVDVDQIESAYVVATGRETDGRPVRIDGVMAYRSSTLYVIVVVQRGERPSSAQSKVVSDILRSWEWR